MIWFNSDDINQNDYIDLEDLILNFNDAISFSTGYLNTDVNGDNVCDLMDLVITYNNSINFVGVMKP